VVARHDSIARARDNVDAPAITVWLDEHIDLAEMRLLRVFLDPPRLIGQSLLARFRHLLVDYTHGDLRSSGRLCG
jgi:hypothetical protein